MPTWNWSCSVCHREKILRCSRCLHIYISIYAPPFCLQICWCSETQIYVNSTTGSVSHLFAAGTFPLRSMDTSTVQGTQTYNNFLFSQAAASSKSIFCRTISCTCLNCLTGALGICGHGFAPDYFQKMLSYKDVAPKINSAKNSQVIKKTLDKLRNHNDTLEFYFCLGWVERSQTPAVFLVTHLKYNDKSIKCHVLQHYKPKLNDFHCTAVVKPNNLCPKSQNKCKCQFLHAETILHEHILDVCVEKGTNGVPFKSCFSKAKVEMQPPNGCVYHMPQTHTNNQILDSYCEKRFAIFNDFVLLAHVADNENML